MIRTATHVAGNISGGDFVVPESIHTSPTEGMFSKTSFPPLWKFQVSVRLCPVGWGGDRMFPGTAKWHIIIIQETERPKQSSLILRVS